MAFELDRRTLMASLVSVPLGRALVASIRRSSNGREGGRETSLMTEAREVIWRRTMDDGSFEQARIEATAGGPRLSGTVLASERGAPLRVDYVVDCDSRWSTRSVAIAQTYSGTRRILRLEHDGRGGWRLDGAPAPALEGSTDVDLGVSPSTNALPVNRLRLEVGASGSLRAAWVRFPSLEVAPAEQAYTRLGPSTYRYRNRTSGFEAELEVDGDGLPVEYAGVWKRVAEGPGGVARPSLPAVSGGFADALLSSGASRELAAAAADFGWLVGGWSADVTDVDPDGRIRAGRGEWWFAWVLEGRAMQDVWIAPPRNERDHPRDPLGCDDRYGSTIRRFDRDAGLWRIVWINPVSGVESRLAGRRDGNRIVLNGEYEGRPIRWGFYEITDRSFVWVGETQLPGGEWRKQAEFRLRRLESPPASRSEYL